MLNVSFNIGNIAGIKFIVFIHWNCHCSIFFKYETNQHVKIQKHPSMLVEYRANTNLLHFHVKTCRTQIVVILRNNVFHINFCHNMHNLWDTAHLKLNDLDLTFQDNPWGELKDNIWCTIYEMQPLENFVTLILPLRVTPVLISIASNHPLMGLFSGDIKEHEWTISL